MKPRRRPDGDAADGSIPGEREGAVIATGSRALAGTALVWLEDDSVEELLETTVEPTLEGFVCATKEEGTVICASVIGEMVVEDKVVVMAAVIEVVTGSISSVMGVSLLFSSLSFIVSSLRLPSRPCFASWSASVTTASASASASASA